MDKNILKIDNLDLEFRRVFIRADLNVPIEDGKITNSHRIMNALPTIRYALDQKARVILASHLGRPQGKDASLSLVPIAEMLSEILDIDVFFVEELLSDVPAVLSSSLKQNQILLLENLRFHEGERKNDEKLAQKLARDIDIYINDAFGVCHRRHMSLCALSQCIEKKAMGFLVKKEIEYLDKIRKNPQRPFVAVLGGSKVQDKLGLIESLMDHVDHLVIGGPMAYVFLKAQGFDLAQTFVADEALSLARELLQRIEGRKKKLYLPLDHIVAPMMNKTHQSLVTEGVVIPEGYSAFDIGPKTREYFSKALQGAQTIFWNGPMGVFEISAYEQGTKAIAQSIVQNKKAFKIVGGGDSARAVHRYSLVDEMDYVSTGGGASLAYIQGKSLPALESLMI